MRDSLWERGGMSFAVVRLRRSRFQLLPTVSRVYLPFILQQQQGTCYGSAPGSFAGRPRHVVCARMHAPLGIDAC